MDKEKNINRLGRYVRQVGLKKIQQWSLAAPAVVGFRFADYSAAESWFSLLHEQTDYPLYCTVLADTSDTEVVAFMQSYFAEIDAITGKNCCFIYFRDLEKAKQMLSFDYSEHAKYIYNVAKITGIKMSKFPCLLFFEEIDSGKYICVSLAKKSQQEIIQLIRQIFDYLHQHKTAEPLRQLKKFEHSQAVQMTKQAVLQNAFAMGKDIVHELVMSFLSSITK